MRRPGDIVGDRYVVQETLGAGGMATVYRAEHVLSRRSVALKVMHDVVRHADAAERFRREASAAARIGHPGLVEVYDAGVDADEGTFFLAMELLEGEHLGRRLRRRGTTRRHALRLVHALMEPLVAAHQAGFVHRDLKPENVMVGPEGRVTLLDLGLAKHRDAKTLTATGNTLGTPHYMAPEQFMSSRDVTAAADVWSVGVVLYETLAGRHPFEAPTPQGVLIRAVTEAPPPLAERLPSLRELAALIDASLARDPDARPTSAALREGVAGWLDVPGDALDAPLQLAGPESHGVTVRADQPGTTPTAMTPTATTPTATPRPGSSGASVDTSSWELHEGLGYRFRIPPGWRSKDSLVHHVAAKYEAEEEGEGLTPRCVLKVEAFPDGDTKAYLSLGLANMTHVGRLYQSVDAELGGRPTLEIDGAFPQQSPPYRTVRRAVVVDGVGYVFMCDGPAERWHELVPTFRAVLASFAFVP